MTAESAQHLALNVRALRCARHAMRNTICKLMELALRNVSPVSKSGTTKPKHVKHSS